MAKKKKFQAGAASVLDDPRALDILPQIQKPNLQSDQIGALRDLLPILAMGATAVTPSIVNKSEPVEEDVIITPGGIIIKPPAGLSEEEKKRLGLGGYVPVGGGMTPTDEKDKLPQSTGGPPPEKIDTTIIDPIPEPIDTGGGFTPIPEEERMQILTMGDKKKESKALVPTKMIEKIDDIDIGEAAINKRFSKTEDYIKANYSGNEKKTLDQWSNEISDPQKGLTLELRDTGMMGYLNNMIASGSDKDKYTASELLKLFQSGPNQIAFGYAEGSAKKLGEDQELLPQNLRTEITRLENMNMVFRPGPLGQFMDQYRNLVTDQLKEMQKATNREDAEAALAKIPEMTETLMSEYPNLDAATINATRQNNEILNSISNITETLRNNQFTNEHMTIAFPNLRSENYQILSHTFKPEYDQPSKLNEHEGSHPSVGHDFAFSRSAKLINYANDQKGTVMMELQTDLFDGKIKSTDIKFPGSQPPEGSTEVYETASDNFYPFSGGAQYWIKQVVKDNLEKAIADGDAYLGWSPADVVAVYENAGDANSNTYKGFKTIYDGRIDKFIKDINKDITKRGKALGLNDKQIESIQLQVKRDGTYKFSKRPGDDYSEATSSRYVQAIENFPGLKNHVRVGGVDKDLILINMPYIDLRAEGFDLELFKKIGLPQFKKGGKTKDKMGDPLIDIEIFMKSV